MRHSIRDNEGHDQLFLQDPLMAAKEILFADDAREVLVAGAELLAQAVSATLGPRGGSVVIQQAGGAQPLVSRDGYTVARHITLNRRSDAGAAMLRDVAEQTAKHVGDGTSTATVLARAIYREGLKHVTAGVNPMALKRGIDRAVATIVDELREASVKVTIYPSALAALAEVEHESARVMLADIARTCVDADRAGRLPAAWSDHEVRARASLPVDYWRQGRAAGLSVETLAQIGDRVDDEGRRRADKALSRYLRLSNVAKVAASGDRDIGAIIAKAFAAVGADGVISVVEGQGAETTLEIVPGMSFDRGYLSPYFVTDTEKSTAVLEDGYILIYDKKISSMKDLLPILEQVAQVGKPLLIIAEDIEGEALATLVVNKIRGTLRVAAVKAPGFGDHRKAMLRDIAILTDGQVISEDVGSKIENAVLNDLGKAKRIVVGADSTTIIEDRHERSDLMSGRINEIRSAIEHSTSDYDKGRLQERLAKLTGGVAVINVGAATESEMKEKKARVEDALHATRAAVEEGIVPGGGVAFIRVQPALTSFKAADADEQIGVEIVRRAIEEPIRMIVQNAG
ncbi:MAG TPA: chaperonin GroEL, partial [Gemmatimonadaceae bacterium]|nr:chaperonin GroEL [Gemmatimonadaceae bacterium]